VDFTGKAAVVTGGASGIGAATAALLAASGAQVAVLDINADGAQAQAKEIEAEGGRALAITVDVSDAEAVGAAIKRVVGEYGEIHALVNCAVSFIAKGADATTAEWERSLGVNVRGYANLVSTCAPHMPPGSAVVNIASISAHIAQPNRWTYNATKGAIVTLTKCQALDLSADGIRVNVVSPGWIWTPEVEKAADGDRARWEPVWGRFHMLRRLGEAVEVAKAVRFLLSDDASFITATELMVDGGYRGIGSEGLGDDAKFAGSA
jgi:NAD(P)-dependent dehydrogenase (short-subunit alcohol dehydrogenase family)